MTMTRFDDPTKMTEGERLKELASILAAGFYRLKKISNGLDSLYPNKNDLQVFPHLPSHVAPSSERSFNLSKQLDYSGEPSLHCPGGLTPDRE